MDHTEIWHASQRRLNVDQTLTAAHSIPSQGNSRISILSILEDADYVITKNYSVVTWVLWCLKSPATPGWVGGWVGGGWGGSEGGGGEVGWGWAYIKENIKDLHCWAWGESIGDHWIPCTKGQWYRKHFHVMKSSWEVDYIIIRLKWTWLSRQNSLLPRLRHLGIQQELNGGVCDTDKDQITNMWLTTLLWFYFTCTCTCTRLKCLNI